MPRQLCKHLQNNGLLKDGEIGRAEKTAKAEISARRSAIFGNLSRPANPSGRSRVALAFAEISAISARYGVEATCNRHVVKQAASEEMAIVLQETLAIKALAGHDE